MEKDAEAITIVVILKSSLNTHLSTAIVHRCPREASMLTFQHSLGKETKVRRNNEADNARGGDSRRV